MKSVLVAVGYLVALAAAQQPGLKRERSRAEAYALEGLGALGGALGCGGLCMGTLYLASLLPGELGDDSYLLVIPAMAVAAATLPAVAGSGVAKVGDELHENGSQTLAIGGAYAGLPLAVGAIVLGAHVGRPSWYHDPYGRQRRSTYWGIPFYVLGAMAIPVGAVVGYNLGAPREPGLFGSRHRGRLGLPAVALTSTELPDHSIAYGVKVQPAGLRF